MVIRWVQSGWLNAIYDDGRRGLELPMSATNVLIEFDLLPSFIQSHPGLANLDQLRPFAFERETEVIRDRRNDDL